MTEWPSECQLLYLEGLLCCTGLFNTFAEQRSLFFFFNSCVCFLEFSCLLPQATFL